MAVKEEILKQQQEEQETLTMFQSTQAVIHEAIMKLGYKEEMRLEC